MSLQERVEPRGQHRAHDIGRKVIRQIVGIDVVSDADRMRQQQIALQLHEIARRDRLVFEFAEAGGDAVLVRADLARLVRALVVLDDPCNQRLGSRHALVGLRIDVDAHARIASDLRQLLDGQRFAVENDHVSSRASKASRSTR